MGGKKKASKAEKASERRRRGRFVMRVTKMPKNTDRKERKLGPYPRREAIDLQEAVRRERSRCYEEALAWCVRRPARCGTGEGCTACSIAAAISWLGTVVAGHSNSCPLSQPRPQVAIDLGIPDDAKCCCGAGDVTDV